MPKDLDEVASRTAKHVKISSMGITAESFLNLQRQPGHTASHIGPPDSEPDPHAGGKCNYRRSNVSSTSRSVTAFTPPETRIR